MQKGVNFIKILITGPDFYNYNTSISEAFKKLNQDVNILHYPILEKIIPRVKLYYYKTIGRIKTRQEFETYKFNVNLNKIQTYNKNLYSMIKILSPDLLLVLKGDIILPQTIKKILSVNNIIPILWCYDNISPISNVLRTLKFYKIIYVFDQNDLLVLKEYTTRGRFLPMGYDSDIYYKTNSTNKNIDVSFVGILEGGTNLEYRIRDKLLRNLIINYPKLNIQIFGRTWAKINFLIAYKYMIRDRDLGKHINNRIFSHKEINNIYNNSKICLNIHREKQIGALNPRTFEILGAGGFQIVDYKPILEDFFDIEKEIASYKNKKELLEKINYFLENEDERNIIAQRGYNKVIKKHTFLHRAQKIIAEAEMVNG
jgi:spore maturation protein CgeB